MNRQRNQSSVQTDPRRNTIVLLLCIMVISHGPLAYAFDDGLPGKPRVRKKDGTGYRPAKTPEDLEPTPEKKPKKPPKKKADPTFKNDFDRFNYYIDRTLKVWELMKKSKCVKLDKWLDEKLKEVKLLLRVAKDRNKGQLETYEDGSSAELTGTEISINLYGKKNRTIEIILEDGMRIYADPDGRILVFRKKKLVSKYYCPKTSKPKTSIKSAPGKKKSGTNTKKDSRTSSLVPLEDDANTRVVNGTPTNRTYVAKAATYLDRGVTYATAAVEEGTTIRFEKPGYAVVATASVVDDEPQTERIPVKPGDTIKSGILIAAQFADGTGFVTRSVPHTPPILVTVGERDVYKDDGQYITKSEVPVSNGNVTAFIGSDRPFAETAIGTSDRSTKTNETYATVLKDGKTVGQVVTFSGLNTAQLANDLRVWTLNEQGGWLREAQLEDSIFDGSLRVQFDRPVYRVGESGSLKISNVNNHLKARSLTHAGEAVAESKRSLKLKPSPNLAGLPVRIPARDTELPFQVVAPGAAQVEIQFEVEGQFSETSARTTTSPLSKVTAATPRSTTLSRSENRPKIRVGFGFQFGGRRHSGHKHRKQEHQERSGGNRRSHHSERSGGGFRIGF